MKRNKIISDFFNFFYYILIKIKVKRMNEAKKQIEEHQSRLIFTAGTGCAITCQEPDVASTETKKLKVIVTVKIE